VTRIGDMAHIADILPDRPPPTGTEPQDAEPTCRTCNDFGYVGRMVPLGHPDFGKLQPCPDCYEQRCAERWTEMRERHIEASLLPPVTRQRLRFATWEGNRLPEMLAAAQAFPGRHHFLTLIGGTGIGKTHLAIAAMWEWLEQGKGTARYWQTARFLNALKFSFKDDHGDTERLLLDAENCGLLLLDDLGVQKGTEWAGETLDEMVNERYLNARPTIFTTNLGLAEHPARIADRLSEGVVVKAQAPSWRAKAADSFAKTQK